MGLTKNYLLRVLENCSEHQFGQDAVEWAIYSGWVTLTGDLQTDLKAIMGEPGQPETGQYDDICDAYRRRREELTQASLDALNPLLEEILRPQSLAQNIP